MPNEDQFVTDGDWRNHGAYVTCVVHATNELVADGAITGTEAGEIRSAAAQSNGGK